jgi:hypothetical protein
MGKNESKLIKYDTLPKKLVDMYDENWFTPIKNNNNRKLFFKIQGIVIEEMKNNYENNGIECIYNLNIIVIYNGKELFNLINIYFTKSKYLSVEIINNPPVKDFTDNYDYIISINLNKIISDIFFTNEKSKRTILSYQLCKANSSFIKTFVQKYYYSLYKCHFNLQDDPPPPYE